MNAIKPVEFRGSSLADLRAFPAEVRREVGYQIDRVQNGCDPDDWKPVPTIGPGVKEIRIRDAQGAFRVMYVAKFGGAIYVLHCFQKKQQQTKMSDLNLAKQRYNELRRELGK